MNTDEVDELYKKSGGIKELNKSTLKRITQEINAYINYRFKSLDKDYTKKRTKLVQLLDITSSVTKIDKENIKSESRYPEIMYARHLFCYMARLLYSKRFSSERVGSVINRHYSTVLYGAIEIENKKYIYGNENIKKDIEQIKSLL